MELSEDILHYVWQYRLYHMQDLRTLRNKSLLVKSPGFENKHSGPDFEYSRLIIDGIEWAGNIEIHLKSSDWYRHQHDGDKAYNNIILHVVYEHDAEIRLADGSSPETLELKDLVDARLLSSYKDIMRSKSWLPCQEQFSSTDDFIRFTWLERVLIERLEEKSEMLIRLLKQSVYDWEEVTYILFARGFGCNVNASPFEALARTISYKWIMKRKLNVSDMESLIFGQAGMLYSQSFIDPYPRELKKQYSYLRDRYQLLPIEPSLWKFLRMRPANFPTIRLAQFAAWCSKGEYLYDKILSLKSIDDYRNIFEDLPVNDYWRNHYLFDKPAAVHSNQLGVSAIDAIILNSVVTILFSYGKYIGKETYIYRAINLLRQLPYEKNQLVGQFRSLGVVVKDAADSQALLQLKKKYCDRYKCLDCGIGLQVLKQNKSL